MRKCVRPVKRHSKMFKQFLFKNVYAHKRLKHAENHM